MTETALLYQNTFGIERKKFIKQFEGKHCVVLYNLQEYFKHNNIRTIEILGLKKTKYKPYQRKKQRTKELVRRLLEFLESINVDLEKGEQSCHGKLFNKDFLVIVFQNAHNGFLFWKNFLNSFEHHKLKCQFWFNGQKPKSLNYNETFDLTENFITNSGIRNFCQKICKGKCCHGCQNTCFGGIYKK